MALTVKDLSPDQLEAYNRILEWARDYQDEEQPLLTLGGYAGSGKSTLVSLVSKQVDLPAFCAYTGKAASVLRRKLTAAGIRTVGTQKRVDGQMSSDQRPFCGTIHSLIYRPCDCREPTPTTVRKPCPDKHCVGETSWDGVSACTKGHVGLVKTQKAFDALEETTKFVYAKKDADGKCEFCGGKEWLRREILDRTYGLIIVDEASMVDDQMLRDLRSFGIPILAVGDHGQLPPVGGSGSLMRAPHLRLERIHRQAEGNPIIALSKMIRETGRLPDRLEGEHVNFGSLRFVDRILEDRYAEASPARMLEMGIACYTNRRRVGLNVTVRRVRGTARNGRELPRAGEHVVCLRNIKEGRGRPPVANGMRGVLLTDADPKQIINHRGENKGENPNVLTANIEFAEDGIEAISYDMLRQQFGREKTFASAEELSRETGIHSFSQAGSLFDYGFAMTVHKMQGSAVSDLVVCVERPGPVGEEDWRRWLYTAVTRASERLTLLR